MKNWAVIVIGILALVVVTQYFFSSPLHATAESYDQAASTGELDGQRAGAMNLRVGERTIELVPQALQCGAAEYANMPAMFHLKTKLGVSYGGGHWFHMAENFMAQHSALRASKGGSTRSAIYFNFDEPGFVSELNGVTKLMVALAALQREQSQPVQLTLHFVHYPLTKADRKLQLGDVLQLPRSENMVDSQVVRLAPDVPTAQRFVITKEGQIQQDKARKASKEAGSDRCAVFHGSIGGVWPTPQRGHWFPNSGDVDNFRSKIRAMCPPDLAAPSVTNNAVKKRRLVIYQRDISRKLFNEEEAIGLLQKAFQPAQWDISVLMHVQDASPCELAQKLSSVDVLVTPHGFQSMLLLFLPRPAVLFEVFPYRYYKRGYGPLSLDYGITHGGVMSPPLSWDRSLLLRVVTTNWCMLSKTCRNYARGDNVLLTQHGVDVLLQLVTTRLDESLRQLGTGTGAGAGKGRDRLYNEL